MQARRKERRCQGFKGSIEKVNWAIGERTEQNSKRKSRPPLKNENLSGMRAGVRYSWVRIIRETWGKGQIIHRIHHSESWNEVVSWKYHMNRIIKTNQKGKYSSKSFLESHQEIQWKNLIS